jgi:hypothetical protein
MFFYIIKIKPRHKHAKWPPSDTTPRTLTLGLFMEFITAAHCTLHNDHDIENIILKIKKHWKLKCEKYTGFKAKMEKNRPIRDQFPNKNRAPIVKNPCFSWLYGLAMVP